MLATINYGTVKKEDSTMAAGTSMVSVTGETGYKVQSYRELYDANGKLISKNKGRTASTASGIRLWS